MCIYIYIYVRHNSSFPSQYLLLHNESMQSAHEFSWILPWISVYELMPIIHHHIMPLIEIVLKNSNKSSLFEYDINSILLHMEIFRLFASFFHLLIIGTNPKYSLLKDVTSRLSYIIIIIVRRNWVKHMFDFIITKSYKKFFFGVSKSAKIGC